MFLLGLDCPARSRSLKGAYGVATRSATPTLDPASVRLGFGICEKDGETRRPRARRRANSVRPHGVGVKLLPHQSDRRTLRALLSECLPSKTLAELGEWQGGPGRALC